VLSFTQTPDHFQVEEQLFFEPEGSGSHCFALFEKVGITTSELKRVVAGHLGIDQNLIKHAGQKDKAAQARQWLSWPAGSCPEPWQEGDVRLLRSALHPHSLSIGHVKQNHFSLWLEGQDSLPDLHQPFLNLYGAQRGAVDLAALLDRLKRLRNWTPFAISQVQAALFNAFALERYRQNALAPLPGELWKHIHSRKTFSSDDFSEQCNRLAAGEISHTGPLFGSRCPLATHGLEQDFLKRHQLDPAAFERWGKKGRGSRRPFWVRALEPSLELGDDGCRLSFTLPAGCYASVWLCWLLDRQCLLDQGTHPDFTLGHRFPSFG